MAVDERRPRADAVTVRLGRALRQERSGAGITQEDLAKKAGAPQGQISYWERGEREPTLSEIERLERALGLAKGALLVAAGSVKNPGDTEGAISIDDRLDRQHRELLLETYRLYRRRSDRRK